MLRGIRYGDVERRDLRDGEDEVVVPFEELPALLVHPRLPRQRTADIGAGEPLGLGDLELDGVLDPFGPLCAPRARTAVVGRVAQDGKRLVDAGEVRLGLFDHAAEILEDVPVRVDDTADVRLERDSAKPAPPGDAHALEAAPERCTEPGTILLIASGLRGSGPAIALRKSATSATERAIGPDTESGDQDPDSLGTRPGDGRKPTTLQKAAGLRSEPPVSLPSAIGTMPQASATAAPPLLPPQVFPRSYGLRVGPNTALNVCDPAPNSGVLVLPTVMAPAARMRVTMSASAVGTVSR